RFLAISRQPVTCVLCVPEPVMSEDVSNFLKQVKELGDRRIEEDEARSRELEEKILQDRKERQARRAERARSISPQKSSPANTPPPSANRTSIYGSQRLNLDSSPTLDPPASPPVRSDDSPQSGPMSGGGLYSPASKENESPFDADNKTPNDAVSPTRSASTARGLSWQRRPNSQASNGSRSRPLSVVAAENAARSSTNLSDPASASESVSRDQIAQSLLSKDPSWFRQTADRGANSGAYRKQQVEEEDRIDLSSLKAQLPGMSRGPSAEPTKDEMTSPTTLPPSSQQRTLGSPLPLTASQRFEPPSGDGLPETDGGTDRQQSVMSPPLGRTSPTRGDRPVSPTKGVGGFVQSAMMKRSDSVSKRWSVQSPPGLQRADSIASNRSSIIKSRPTSMYRGGSIDTFDTSPPPPDSSQGKDEIAPSPGPDTRGDETTPPSSPSRTMDPRRWSPTKASWLESALKKPESPKPKPTPPPSNQPAWMAELAKAKAQKAANPESGTARSPTISHKHQVSIGGLMRSNAPGISSKPQVLSAYSRPTTPIATQRTGGPGSVRNASVDSNIPSDTTPEISKPTSSKPIDPVVLESKPKPETPTKNDFRASLKSRQTPPTPQGSDNVEFKSVFGTLRKTTTQNYVAPDELKNNIMRGKAALNLTGGPKKTERKDDFKEAILAKKKEFQKVQAEGKGVARSSSVTSDTPVPEGLIKRTELGRSGTSAEVTGASAKSETASPTIQTPARLADVDNKTKPYSDVGSRSPGIRERNTNEVLPQRSHVTSPLRESASATAPNPHKEASAPAKLPGKIGGSVLANRFNPALAGLLARGPPPMASSGSGNNKSSDATESTSTSAGEPASGPKLTHMTKNRARGPKRKAPTAVAATSPLPAAQHAKDATPQEAEKSSSLKIENETMKAEPQATPLVAPKTTTAPLSLKLSGAADATQSTAEPPREAAARSPSPTKRHVRTKSKVFEQVAAFAAHSNPPSPTKGQESDQATSQPASPKKLDMRRMSIFFNEPAATGSVEVAERESPERGNAPSKPKPNPVAINKPNGQSSPKPEIRSPPPKLSPNRPLPQPESAVPARNSKAGEVSPKPVIMPKNNVVSPGLKSPASTSPVMSPSANKPRPLSLKPQPSPEPKSGLKSPPDTSPIRSPTKQASEATSVLNEFFGSARPRRNYRVDAAQLLMEKPQVSGPRIQTLDVKMFQFSADGKKIPVSAHNERVLFEGEMYLCSHTFKNEAGQKTSQVYFWVGDEVPSTVVEDASIFVARETRALGGNLVRLYQGKETPEFMAALGGIVITCRGSSNKYDSLAPHMLCGRRYLGQIVFDEVEFAPTALCSGFPYVVANGGGCYLWKGKGSGIDELSCARLIGMEYALSGELQEVEDGQEPSSFWSLFGGASKMGSADHWRLKPNYDKYCSRLFLSDAASKQQIVEVLPFSQKDLRPTSIYVLDAFFEMYIIVGSRAQPQYASFHNALEFAQEYAILAASMEDRPFVPISTVVLEGIPKDLKSVFRKWQDADSPTITNPPGAGTGLRRGRSLRIVPLNTALQALRD
ncbi:hypothetical protein BX600DRAFT_378394, partial [Xylariales sp. PMI_506]